jgi:DNA-binding IclR family transcriptional regulator
MNNEITENEIALKFRGRINHRNKITQPNQSVEKVLIILKNLSQQKEPIKLSDLADELNMSQSTLLRYLLTLQKAGYVEQDRVTTRYYLTLKICQLADNLSNNIRIGDVAVPIMKQISIELKETVCFAVEKDSMIVYVDVVFGPQQILRSMQRIGNIAPMYCTGIGKLMLLNKSDEELDEYIRSHEFERFTDNTVTSGDELKIELDTVRKLGYALDNEECEIGAKCIAVPIMDYKGKIVAGLSVTGFVFSITEDFINMNIDYLNQMANIISRKLGYKG